MENTKSILNNKTVYSELKDLEYSIQSKQLSHAEIKRTIGSLTDLIPDDGYEGFYVNQLKSLGYPRFMELAKKARIGSDTPQRLFCWMLKNNTAVR